MSIYNRKMFKRNAREKLNQTAGIQSFQLGGQVTANQDRLNRISNMMSAMFPRPNAASYYDPTLTRRAYDMNLGGPSLPRPVVVPQTPSISQGIAGTLGDESFTPDVGGIASIPTNDPNIQRPVDELTTEPFTNIRTNDPDIMMSPDDMMLQGPTGTPDQAADFYGDIFRTLLPGFTGQKAAEEKEKVMQNYVDREIPGYRTPNQEPSQVPYYPDRSVAPGQPMPDELTTEPFTSAVRADRDAGMPDELTTEPFTNVASDDATLSEQTNPGKTGAETAIETVEKMSTEDPGSAMKSVGDIVNQFLENDDQESASDTLLAAHGQLDPDEPLSTEDRIEKMRETIRKFYGKDPGEERRIDGLNLAMMGFAIAGGESPQALQNIANGALAGVKAMKEEKQRRQDREDKITGLAVSTILGREEKESDRTFRKELLDISNRHDLKKFSLQDASTMKRFTADMNFRALINDQNNALQLELKNKDIDLGNARMQNDMNSLIMRLESAEAIASDDRNSRETIAKAGEDAGLIRSVIANLPDGYGFAMIEGQNKGLKGNDLIEYATENGKKFAADTLLTGPDSLRRAATTIIPQIMKEQDATFDEASRSLYNDPSFQSMYGDQITALNIPLVEVQVPRSQTDPTLVPSGDKLIVGTILDANGNPVASLDRIGSDTSINKADRKKYFIVQADGTLKPGTK